MPSFKGHILIDMFIVAQEAHTETQICVPEGGKLNCSRAMGRPHRQLQLARPSELLQVEARGSGFYIHVCIIHCIWATTAMIFRDLQGGNMMLSGCEVR